jgi:hypothetical protein
MQALTSRSVQALALLRGPTAFPRTPSSQGKRHRSSPPGHGLAARHRTRAARSKPCRHVSAQLQRRQAGAVCGGQDSEGSVGSSRP